jgi:siroheme synthase
VRTTLESLEADIKAADISPPAIIVVGPVAGLTAP